MVVDKVTDSVLVAAQRDRLAACEPASAPRTLRATDLRATAMHSWVSAHHLHG